MVDISDDGRRVRGQLQSGIVRRRRWTMAEKGGVVAEAVAPGAVIAEVARRHDLAPQHLSNWIRAAKDGHFALPCEEGPGFVPAVVCPAPQAGKASRGGRAEPIEIMLGSVVVRLRSASHYRDLSVRPVRAVVRTALLHKRNPSQWS